jgi:hypothetical protein
VVTVSGSPALTGVKVPVISAGTLYSFTVVVPVPVRAGSMLIVYVPVIGRKPGSARTFEIPDERDARTAPLGE